MLASFSIAPIGIGDELKEAIADILAIVEESGLPYTLGAMQTTVEGTEEEVIGLIMKCHRKAREMSARVLTHIAIDDREGATGRLTGKIADVEEVLGRKLSHE
jgi:uncharacterized protein (TIGR00106 family)